MTLGGDAQMAGDVQVWIDDRARLMGALLAATRAPELAQRRAKHGTHAHARATRKRVLPLTHHPAALAADALLEQGTTVDSLFALAFMLDPATLQPAAPMDGLPPGLATGLADFAWQADLAGLWAGDAEAWQRSVAEAERTFAGVSCGRFLERFFGPLNVRFGFMPNIGYPADETLALMVDNELIAVSPPPAAWGESPPWPFDEDPAHVLGAALTAFSRLCLASILRELPEGEPLPVSEKVRARYPAWHDQLAQLFSAGLVALFLREQLGEREASAWLLMEKRLRGLDALPAVVAALDHFQGERVKNRPAALARFLPRLPALLHAEGG